MVKLDSRANWKSLWQKEIYFMLSLIVNEYVILNSRTSLIMIS